MALFTGKGDRGDTGVFDSKKRISKASLLSEALGTCDELNSFLGICKTHEGAQKELGEGKSYAEMFGWIQQQLFIVQAQLAGAEKNIDAIKIQHMETAIESFEKELPPITTFFVSGGTAFAAHIDVARTLARRAERRVVDVHNAGERRVEDTTLAFLNRLSSLLYAMARLANLRSGITEEPPKY